MMKLPKVREICEALGSFFSRPYTTKFPFTPFEPAPQFRGRPHYHDEDCTGCGACVQVCPAGALQLTDTKGTGKRLFKINYAHCIGCGQCEEKCMTGKGIRLVNEMIPAVFDPAEVTETMEKALVHCESCGETIACRDQLLWLADRLGPYAYALPTLILVKELGGQNVPAASRDTMRREDLYKILCPHCRRQVVILDVF